MLWSLFSPVSVQALLARACSGKQGVPWSW